LDASALAKRYALEIGSALIDYLFANVSPDRFFVFNLGMAEVLSVLVRKKNAGILSAAVVSQAIANLGKEVIFATSLRKIVADTSLVILALPYIETHSVNATDALVLQSALELAGNLRVAGNDLVLVASDKRLLRAAQTEGLVTFDPETQSQTDLDALLVP
jgi:predicted nucleic acid-binding protein